VADAGDRLTAELAAIKARAESATAGPWWFDEDDQVFRLHGVYTIIPPFIEGMPGQVVNHQILKAPKTGTPYAEYWPNEADAAFIVAARTDVPRMADALEKLLAAADRWRLYAAEGDAADDCARDVREIIARELTRKAPDGG
jgi:hypothetical protein